MTEEQLPELYAPYNHTLKLALVYGDAPAKDAEWADFDLPSSHQDARSALVAWLRGTFEDPSSISESRDGVFTVVDPDFPEGQLKRMYRVS